MDESPIIEEEERRRGNDTAMDVPGGVEGENLLFGYQEFPNVTEEPVVPGRLSTKGTPENWSDSRMDLHFQPWEDGHLYFKPIDTVFAYYIGDAHQANE